MEFRVLGPLEVWEGDRQIVIGAAKQRALLAALLLHANETVPTERLIDLVWGARQPLSAKSAVHNYVMRLRRLLIGAGTGDGDDLLVTRPTGYLISASQDQLDLLRFERLVSTAGKASARGDVERAAEGLRAALALWRGAALANVGADPLRHVEAPRLEEQRLAAVDDWVEAELALGRHREIVAELRELVAAHPLRERLRGQLMLALYRSGRRADALEVFQETWRLFADELGLEPGEELRRLQREILTDTLTRAAGPATGGRAAGAPVSLPAVAQLPPDVVTFTGRERELRRLHDLVKPTGEGGRVALAAVYGGGGIGKSALAIHLAHRRAGLFPDGQLYVNLHGATAGLRPLEPLEVLGRFLRALGVPGGEIPIQVDEAAARFRSAAAGRRLLVVLDNARDAAQVLPLLPASPECAVLVTSRRVLGALECIHLRLDVLPRQDAVTLLACVCGAERIAAEPDAAAEVARSCGYLPLALRIAGARLAARPCWPVAVLAERLSDTQRRLDELELGEVGIRASFAVSFQELAGSADLLDRGAAAAFGLLGVPDGEDVGVPAAARLLDQPEGHTERVLERLVDAQLLETPAPGRYRLHDLLGLYAREHAEQRLPERERAAALTRVLRFYVATAWKTLALLRPGDQRLEQADNQWTQGGLELRDAAMAKAWLETERANLLTAVRQAATTAGVPGAAVLQLALPLIGFYTVRGYYQDWVQVDQTALEVARRLGDRAAQAQVHNDLGIAHQWKRHYVAALACHQQSLQIRRELGDRRGLAVSLTNLGVVHTLQERYDEALACQQESLAIRRELGDRRGLAVSLTNLGLVYQRLRRYDEALACQRESLVIEEELGDRHGQAATLTNLGVVHQRQERYQAGLVCLRESLAIYRELGSRWGQAENLQELGILHRSLGDGEQSLVCLRESLAIYQELDEPHGQAESLRELGVTLLDLGRPDEARAHWLQALAIFERLGATTATDQVHALLGTDPGPAVEPLSKSSISR